MDKKEIQQAAKEFCEAEGVERYYYDRDQEDECIDMHEFAVNFLQSMIDQGHIVEASKLTWNEEAVKNIHNAYELLESKGVFGVGKEDLKFAFTAGRLFESACSCKDCPKPVDFNEWYKNFKPCTTVAEPTVSSAGKEVNRKLPDEEGWFDVDFKVPTLSVEYECILSDGVLIKLKYNFDLNTFSGNTSYKHGDSVFVVKWRYIKSPPASTVQKDQSFLNFITTTGLSAADQNIIKGVYFKYIEQCQ